MRLCSRYELNVHVHIYVKEVDRKKSILNIEMCTFKLHRINDYQFKVVHIPLAVHTMLSLSFLLLFSIAVLVL